MTCDTQAVTCNSKWYRPIISETVLDRDIVTKGHEQEVIYGLFNNGNCDDLGCILVRQGHSSIASFLTETFDSCEISILTKAGHASCSLPVAII